MPRPSHAGDEAFSQLRGAGRAGAAGAQGTRARVASTNQPLAHQWRRLQGAGCAAAAAAGCCCSWVLLQLGAAAAVLEIVRRTGLRRLWHHWQAVTVEGAPAWPLGFVPLPPPSAFDMFRADWQARLSPTHLRRAAVHPAPCTGVPECPPRKLTLWVLGGLQTANPAASWSDARHVWETLPEEVRCVYIRRASAAMSTSPLLALGGPILQARCLLPLPSAAARSRPRPAGRSHSLPCAWVRLTGTSLRHSGMHASAAGHATGARRAVAGPPHRAEWLSAILPAGTPPEIFSAASRPALTLNVGWFCS